jgi:hypothetical protein
MSEGGSANLRRFNDERSRRILPMITDELKRCARRSVQFKSVGMLAGFLAEHCKVHRTTLLRNPAYSSLLYDYLARQRGAAGVVSDDTDSVAILKAKIAVAQAEVGTLRAALKRANKLLTRSIPVNPATSGGEMASAMLLLCLVLERVDTIVVDRKSRSIIDLAARPSERVVAGHARASGFIDWVDRHRELPGVSGVRFDPSG